MNPRHLGDCLDYYKRWFLHDLLGLVDVAAIPMFSGEWLDADKALYERMVGVTIIQHNDVPNRRDRLDYFLPATIPANAQKDIFLDPDTGFRIVTARPQRRQYSEYLFAEEVDVLLQTGSERLAIIYDQSISHGSELESATLKLRELGHLGLHAFAYCAQVAMIAVSRSPSRVEQITQTVRCNEQIPQDRFRSTTETRNVA